MKLLTLLKEIGDTTKTYPVSGPTIKDIQGNFDTDHIADYIFNTPDGDQFSVSIQYEGQTHDGASTMIIVSFYSKESGYGAKQQVLSSQAFMVMATVIKIIKDFIDENPWVTDIMFYVSEPHKETSAKKEKFYLAFLKKQFPQHDITNWNEGEYIISLNR